MTKRRKADPQETAMYTSRLRAEASCNNLVVTNAGPNHLQVCDDYGPVLDVWPSRSKYREVDPEDESTTALIGGARQAIKMAVAISARRPERAEAPSGLSRPERHVKRFKEVRLIMKSLMGYLEADESEIQRLNRLVSARERLRHLLQWEDELPWYPKVRAR